ncbi:MAG: hypothetical protein FJ161_04450, partial [Gammaproteobacteria bacterium]|nr:hypothetical protein [Gammaproteobacteria bacterium]
MDNMNKQSVTELLQSTESNYSFGIFPYYPLSSIQSAEYALNIRHNLLFKIIKKDYQWNTLLKRYPVEQVFLWIDNHHPLTEKEKKDAENIWKKLKLQPIADESIKIPVLNISYKIFCDTIAARCLIHHPEAFVRLKSALLKACDVNASQEDDIDYSISIHNKIQKVFHTVPGIECFAGTILDMLQEDFEKTFSFFYTDRVVEKYLSMTITRLDQKTHQQYATTFLSACIHAVWPEATFQ